MNRIIQNLSAVLVPILLCTGPLAGCSASGSDPAPATSENVASVHDGVTVFRGLFFGRGDVATALPELWSGGQTAVNPLKSLNRADQIRALQKAADDMEKSGADDASKSVRNVAQAMIANPNLDPAAVTEAKQEALIATIAAKDPTFFDRFGAAMQSGDRLRIDAMLDQSTAMIRSLAKKAAVDRGTSDNGTQLLQGDRIELDDVLVIVFVVVAVLVFWFVDSDGVAAGTPGQRNLQRTQLVDLLARRLHA